MKHAGLMQATYHQLRLYEGLKHEVIYLQKIYEKSAAGFMLIKPCSFHRKLVFLELNIG